jgi:hypothetical protein
MFRTWREFGWAVFWLAVMWFLLLAPFTLRR